MDAKLYLFTQQQYFFFFFYLVRGGAYNYTNLVSVCLSSLFLLLFMGSLHFLILFMGPTVLFQLTFIFI